MSFERLLRNFWAPVLAKRASRKGKFALFEAEGRVCKFKRPSLRLVRDFVLLSEKVLSSFHLNFFLKFFLRLWYIFSSMNIFRASGKEILWGSLLISLLFTMVVSTGCASFQFKRKINQLKVGMTKDEVQAILGSPTGMERKQIASNDLREIWIYHVPRVNPLTPLYPDLYILAFSNGKLIGWNLPNPYDPALVSLIPATP